MSSLMAKALPTLPEVDRVLTGPGAPFELQTMEIDGIPLRTYKRAPQHLGELLEASRNWKSREFIVYENERLTFDQHYQAVALLAHELVERYGIDVVEAALEKLVANPPPPLPTSVGARERPPEQDSEPLIAKERE